MALLSAPAAPPKKPRDELLNGSTTILKAIASQPDAASSDVASKPPSSFKVRFLDMVTPDRDTVAELIVGNLIIGFDCCV